MPSDRKRILEKKIAEVHDSTYTTFHFMAKIHNWLRLKSKLYYNWHLKKKNRKTNQYALVIFVLILSVGLIVFAFVPIFGGQATYNFNNVKVNNEKLPKIYNVKGEISAILEKGIVNNRLAVYWYTDRPATSYVDYYAEGTSLQIESQSNIIDKKYADSLNLNHIVTIDGLITGEKYCFRVRSRDKDGFEAVSDFFVIKTPSKKQTTGKIILDTIEKQFGRIPSFWDIIKNS